MGSTQGKEAKNKKGNPLLRGEKHILEPNGPPLYDETVIADDNYLNIMHIITIGIRILIGDHKNDEVMNAFESGNIKIDSLTLSPFVMALKKNNSTKLITYFSKIRQNKMDTYDKYSAKKFTLLGDSTDIFNVCWYAEPNTYDEVTTWIKLHKDLIDINHQATYGLTCLMFAIMREKINIARFLIKEFDCDLSLKVNKEYTNKLITGKKIKEGTSIMDMIKQSKYKKTLLYDIKEKKKIKE
jgi:hypothetical protein